MDGWRFRAEQQLLTNVRVATVPVVLLTGTDNAEKSAKALHAAGFIEALRTDLLLSAVLKALKTSQRAATRPPHAIADAIASSPWAVS
jgi:hypothetical protein